MTTKQKIIGQCLLSPWGQAGVFDSDGNQIPELQADGFFGLWAKMAESKGYDPVGVEFELVPSGQRARITPKTEYGYGWEIIK